MAKLRRLPNTRRALTAGELQEINDATRSGGNDVVLDALLLRLLTETARRRGGALKLRLVDLDVRTGLVRLVEKGGTQRWQPITVDLAQRLADHAQIRGSVLPGDALLRFRDGRPLTSRRYDQLWKRIGTQLDVGRRAGSVEPLATTHHTDLGRTTLRVRHRPCIRRPTDSTGTYIKDIHDVATALSSLTGQPHPLAR